MRPAHLVGFIAGRFGRRRAVRRSGRRHAGAQDHPLSFGNVPGQRTVRSQILRNIHDRSGRNQQRRIFHGRLGRPLVLLPIGQRRGVHFGQRFFTVTFHARSSRKFDFVQCALLAGVLHNQPEIGSGRSRNRNHDRRGTVETDSQRFGRTAVDLEIGYRAIAVTLFYLQRAGGFKGLNRRTYDQGAGGKRFRRGQVDRQRPGRRKYDRGSRIAIGQVSYPGHLRLRHDSGGHLYPGVFRRRIGDHLDILKQFVRLGQLRYQPLGSRNVGFGRSQVTHRLFGFDPRAARLAPAGRIENTDIDTQFPGGLQRRVQDIPPLVGKDFNRPVGNTAILDIADERTVDSRFFHRL